MPTSQNSKRKDSPPTPPSGQARHAGEIAELADLNDWARFVGEGGREPTAPDCVDVPLENAIWRRPTRTNQNSQQKRQYE
jgi:hypothetical protein